MQKRKMNSYLLVGASVLVLASCLPEEEATFNDRQLKIQESQVALYAKSFQNYSSRSLNALVNSGAWQIGTFPDGIINAGIDLGLSTGNDDQYISSAVCTDGTDRYHITWFDQTDSSGDLTLKGVGDGRLGQISSRIRSVGGGDNFARVSGADRITLNDGTNVSLAGNCATLNIPAQSAVMAVALANPEDSESNVTKTVMRSVSCPAGRIGGIMQSVIAVVDSDNQYNVGAATMASENEVLGNDSLPWNVVSEDCSDPIVAFSFEIDDTVTTDYIQEGSNVFRQDSTLADAIATDLTDIACSTITKTTEEQERDNREARFSYRGRDTAPAGTTYETCGEDLPVEIKNDTTVVEDEDAMSVTAMTLSCPNSLLAPSGSLTVSSGINFNGLPSSLDGKTGEFTSNPLTGNTVVNLIERVWISTEYDDDNRSTTKSHTTKELEGVSINCNAPQTLTFSCAQLYPAYSSGQYAISGTGVTYTRSIDFNGWDNPDNMSPNDPSITSWALYNPANCTITETKPQSCLGGGRDDKGQNHSTMDGSDAGGKRT